MLYVILVIIIGALLLLSISLDNQLQRIEKKINALADDVWSLLNEEKGKDD